MYFTKSSLLLSSREKPSSTVTLISTHSEGCLRIDYEINTDFSFVFSKGK